LASVDGTKKSKKIDDWNMTKARPEVSWVGANLSADEVLMWSRYADKVSSLLPSGYLSSIGSHGSGNSDGFVFGRCDLRIRQGGNSNVEGVYVQPFLPSIRAELHMVHELVHAWIFLARVKNGRDQLLKSGGHAIDSLEEDVCNLAALEYTKRVVTALVTNKDAVKASPLEKAKHAEKIKIGVFLIAKLQKNGGQQKRFLAGLNTLEQRGWNYIVSSVMDIGYF